MKGELVGVASLKHACGSGRKDMYAYIYEGMNFITKEMRKLYNDTENNEVTTEIPTEMPTEKPTEKPTDKPTENTSQESSDHQEIVETEGIGVKMPYNIYININIYGSKIEVINVPKLIGIMGGKSKQLLENLDIYPSTVFKNLTTSQNQKRIQKGN